jgi:hypothetical protein
VNVELLSQLRHRSIVLQGSQGHFRLEGLGYVLAIAIATWRG